MNQFFVLSCIVVLAAAAPLDDSKNTVVLKYENDNIGVDGYKFAFETSDGTSRQEQAELKNAGTENEAISVKGSYSFIGDDGQTYTVDFIADENGYQPSGAHLPK